MNKYDDLCKYCNLLYQKGLAPGCSGNASIRKETFVAITASGVSMNDVSKENIVSIDFNGKIIGTGKASSESFMHCLIYKNRKDVNAIIHSHSPFLSTLALKGLPIEKSQIVELEYLFKGKVPIVKYNPPGSKELAEQTAETLKEYNTAIMENHGAIVAAKSIKDAFYMYEVLEYTAQVYIQRNLL